MTTTTQNSPAAVSARDLTKVYGTGDVAVTALDRVSVDVARGAFTAIMGPSGSGKSTLMHLLAGLDSATSGQVVLGGTELTSLTDKQLTVLRRERIGFVFQAFNLLPMFTAEQNITLPSELAGTKIDREWFDLLVGTFGLTDRLTHKPHQLSGGQQQRVAIARAIAIRPDLLLLDEPLSNLDARLRMQMRSEIRRIQAETGLSVVLVTHDQSEALEMSDQMVLMKEGRIQQQGSPQQVFPAPENRFVAEFLGYENFVPLPDGTELTVRPEHLAVHAGRPGGAGSGLALDGTVEEVVYRGVDVLITVRAHAATGEEMRLLSDVRATAAADVHPGEQITVQAAEQHLVALQPDPA